MLATLHVDFGLDWRGGQSQALLLMKGLQTRGHVAELLTVNSAPLAHRASRAGIAVHTVGRQTIRMQGARCLRRLLAEGRFHILHLHDAHALTAAWLAGAHCRVRTVASRRLAYRLQRNRFALARYRSVHRILAVSQFVAESVVTSGVPADRVEVVYDGIEFPPMPTESECRSARQMWKVDDRSALLGCVGYLLPEKGQEALIRMLPEVLAQFPDCRLMLAGEGPCRGRLVRLTRQLGVESAVHFAGFVEDVAHVYQALDAFLFPSLAEPLGSSLLMAMAYGLPVVAVGRGAVPEVVEDGRTGLLVAESEPAGIAKAVVQLLRNNQLAAQLGASARESIAQRFTADHMVDHTLDAYSRVGPPMNRIWKPADD